MAEKELAILIRARDLASRTIGKVRKEIGTLGSAGSKAMHGLSTAMKRVGIAAAVSLAGGVALGARSLGHLERVTNQTNAVLDSTRGAAGQSAKAIRDHAEALEQLTTADDKNIQEAQNLLLTFTKIGGKTFPKATEATVNMAIAMAKGDVAAADFKGTALQVGKALNDPLKGITALSRAGVSFTKQQKDQIKSLVKAGKVEEAQALILKELATEFGNAGKAAGTGFEADMRRVEDAGEDLSQALARGVMPALSRAAKFLSTKLADPAVVKQLDEIGRGLGDAAMAALDFVETIDFKAIGSGLKTAADAAKTIVSLFMGLPDWVKTAVVTGWGLNKLTGGALSTVITGLASGLIKGVLGMNAGVVNINAGVVNGPGGVPGKGGGGGGVLTPIIGLTAALVAVEETWRAMQEHGAVNTALAGQGLNAAEIAALKYYQSTVPEQQAAFKHLGYIPTRADFESATRKLTNEVDGTTTAVERMRDRAGKGLDTLRTSNKTDAKYIAAAQARTAMETKVGAARTANAATVAGFKSAVAAKTAGDRAAAASRAAGSVARSGGLAAAAAIRAKRLAVNVNTTVTNRISIRETANAVSSRSVHKIL